MSVSAGERDGSELIKIGDFARLAGTNLRTLRYYEEIGILAPAARSAGGFRYYRPRDLHRLRMVHSLQALGLELQRIRELMSTREDAGRVELARVRSALQAQSQLLATRIDELRSQREKIEQALAKLHDCDACDFHPTPANDFCRPCQLDGKPLPEDLSALF